MLTTMVENWPGFRDGIMGPDLMAEMRAQAERFGTEVLEGNVTSVDLQAAAVHSSTLDRGDTRITSRRADHRHRRVGALAGDRLRPQAVRATACRPAPPATATSSAGKPIAVVGGGDSAMEEAIYLTKFASKVTVVHRRDTLRASKIMQDKAFANPKIEFIWDSEVADIKDVGKGEVTGIVVRNLKTGALRRAAARRRVHRHRPHAEHRRSSRVSSSSTPTATSSRTTARTRACPACSPRATCRTTCIGRRSPPPGRAAWRRSTPSAILDDVPQHLDQAQQTIA